VGGDSGSEIIQSHDFRGGKVGNSANGDLQGMYDRVMGSNSTEEVKERVSGLMKSQQTLSQVNPTGNSGTLIHNPTINQ